MSSRTRFSSIGTGLADEQLRLPLSVARLVAALGGEPVGEGAGKAVVRALGELDRAGPDELTFYDSPAYRGELDCTRAGVVVLPHKLAGHTALPRIAVEGSARSYLGRLVELLVAGTGPPRGIDPRACVDPSARIDASSSVAAGAVVGAHAAVGPGAVLRANSVLGAHCRLGARSTLHEGAVVGSEGFGFFSEGGVTRRFPHLGAVSVGEDVEIGANSCIDRGVLGDTVLGDRVKIDNLVQIGHNVRVGHDCVICGAAAIAGSARLEENCVLGGAVRINGHVRLSRGTKVMGASVVKKSVFKPGQTLGGFIPAMESARFARLWRAMLKLSGARRGNGC